MWRNCHDNTDLFSLYFISLYVWLVGCRFFWILIFEVAPDGLQIVNTPQHLFILNIFYFIGDSFILYAVRKYRTYICMRHFLDEILCYLKFLISNYPKTCYSSDIFGRKKHSRLFLLLLSIITFFFEEILKQMSSLVFMNWMRWIYLGICYSLSKPSTRFFRAVLLMLKE